MWDKLLTAGNCSLHPGGEALTKRMLGGCGISSGKALDFACGIGTSCALLSELGFETYGIDSNAAFLEEARQTAKNAALIHADGQSIPFDDGMFDVILCECVLSVFRDKDAAASELYRLLNPEGCLVWSDVCSIKPENSFSMLGWTEFLENAGFETTAIFPSDKEWKMFVSQLLWDGADLGDIACSVCREIPAREMSYCYGYAKKRIV